MEKISINGKPYLIGCDNLRLEPIDWLIPGESVRSIGEHTKNGKESSSCRYYGLSAGFVYSGITDLEYNGWIQPAMLIEVPKHEMKGEIPDDPLYKVFFLVPPGDIIIPDFDFLGILIFHSVVNGKRLNIDRFESNVYMSGPCSTCGRPLVKNEEDLLFCGGCRKLPVNCKCLPL